MFTGPLAEASYEGGGITASEKFSVAYVKNDVPIHCDERKPNFLILT